MYWLLSAPISKNYTKCSAYIISFNPSFILLGKCYFTDVETRGYSKWGKIKPFETTLAIQTLAYIEESHEEVSGISRTLDQIQTSSCTQEIIWKYPTWKELSACNRMYPYTWSISKYENVKVAKGRTKLS